MDIVCSMHARDQICIALQNIPVRKPEGKRSD